MSLFCNKTAHEEDMSFSLRQILTLVVFQDDKEAAIASALFSQANVPLFSLLKPLVPARKNNLKKLL